MDGFRRSRATSARALPWATASLIIAIALSLAGGVSAQSPGQRSGKEVVDSSCISCHGAGVKGAPKIGDQKAWAARASAGLNSLTESALSGIRNMPPHGGNPKLSNLEIERAITYMVNQSGGHWTEPISRTRPPAERSGAQVVQAQCAQCHEKGVGGAPVIGDRAAWIPRVKEGLNTLVRSAINGHGGMPPRGGAAQLTDAEIRDAVVYMLNPVVTVTGKRPAGASGTEQNFKIVGDTTIYFGVISADAIRRRAKEFPPSVSGAVPAGPDQFYVTVALLDADSGKRIPDATVTARVAAGANAGRETPLKAVTLGDAPSFGGYFTMAGPGPFEVTVHVRRADKAGTAEARFEYVP